MYCDGQKGSSQDKVILNREKIKHVALSIAKLCLAEDISISKWVI